MEEVVNSVQRLASNATQIGRRNIIDRLQELCYSIETPDDTLTRLMFMVGLIKWRSAYISSLTSGTELPSIYTPQRPALAST